MADKQQKVTIDIRAKTNQATNEIKKLNAQVSQLGKQNAGLKQTTAQVNQMSRSFASLTKHISQLAIIYGAFQGLQTTVRTFAQFEESITKLGVISGATTTELKEMATVSEELGSTTIFTASQVALGMNAMAMAGLTAEESMTGISSALDLSAIGMIDVEASALIATRAMNGFNLEAEDMGRISDVMAKGVTSSATTITELGNAYEKVASVATTFGVSLEETTALLGVLADAGRTGSEAGTQLKITLSRLAGNKEAKKFLDELGVSIYDASGAILPFTTQMRNLKAELDKLSEAERNIKMAEIFGSEALASANIFLKNIDNIDSKVNELKDSFGFASKTAKKMMDNLTGDWKEFNSALEGLIINLGKGLSPALREILDEATEFIQTLDADEVKEFGEGIGDLAKMLKDAVDVVIDIAGAIKGFSESLTDMTGISGSTQVKLLILVGGLNKFKTVALGMESVLGGFILKQTKLTAVFGASAVKIPILTQALVRLKVAFRALTTVMKTNPFVLVATAIVGIGTAILYSKKQTNDWNESLDKMDKGLKLNQDALEATEQNLKDMNTAGRNAYGDFIQDQILDTEKSINKLTTAIEEEKNLWFTNAEKVVRMERMLKGYVKTQEGLIAQEELLVVVNKEIKEAIDKATKAQVKQAKANEQAKEDSEKLTKAREKEIESIKKNLKTRVTETLNAIEKIKGEETELTKKILDLNEKLVEDLKALNQTRLEDELNIDSEIADILDKGKGNYAKYKSEQKRADEALAKARKALAEGDRETAELYFSQYKDLIRRAGGDEITERKKVSEFNRKTREWGEKYIEKTRLTQKASSDELMKDLKDEKKFQSELHDFDEKRIKEIHATEVDALNEVLKLKKAERLGQIEYLVNLNKIATVMTGMSADLDFTNSINAIKEIDTQLNATATKKRVATLDTAMNNSGAETDYGALYDMVTQPLKPIVSLDTVNVKKETNNTKKEVEEPTEMHVTFQDYKDARALVQTTKEEIKEPTELDIRLELDEARQEVEDLQLKASEMTEADHYVRTTNAIAEYNRLASILGKPTYSDHYIRIHRVETRSTGGEIQKFNEGGHARKTGVLGGYGGGDRVKALLEAGEFIIRKEAVKALGLDRLYQINQGQLPKYQTGGQVGEPAIPKFATGGAITSTSPSKTVELNLNVGGQTFTTMADEDVASALASYLERSTF